MPAGPFRALTDGVAVAVSLTPKASANAIRGIGRDAAGAAHIRAAVTAPPENGKANAALLTLLAGTWNLPKKSLTVTSGAGSRRKVVHVAGPPAEVSGVLETWRRTPQ